MTEPTIIPVDNDIPVLGTSSEASLKENCDASLEVVVKPTVSQVSPNSDKGNKENTAVRVVKPFSPRVTPEKMKKSYYYSSNYDKQVEQKKRFKRIPCHFFDITYTNYCKITNEVNIASSNTNM